MARSTSYYPRDREQKRQRERELLDRIEKILAAHQCYGYRPVTHTLRRQGVIVNHKVVQRLMKQSGLSKKAQKKFIATTNSQHGYDVYPNRYQNQRAFAPNQIWLADITYIQLRDYSIFLAAILDAYSRRVIGWALSRSLHASVVVAALQQALKHRTPLPGCIHHSDRGVQYACGEYVTLLKQHGFQISMSRTGNPRDNGMMERFFRTLKYEEVYLTEYADEREALASIRHFIDQVYNEDRLHSRLGYVPPVEFETQYYQTALTP